jgi:hypothetical protein
MATAVASRCRQRDDPIPASLARDTSIAALIQTVTDDARTR